MQLQDMQVDICFSAEATVTGGAVLCTVAHHIDEAKDAKQQSRKLQPALCGLLLAVKCCRVLSQHCPAGACAHICAAACLCSFHNRWGLLSLRCVSMWLPALKSVPIGTLSIQMKPGLPAVTCQPLHLICLYEVLYSLPRIQQLLLPECYPAAAAPFYQKTS